MNNKGVVVLVSVGALALAALPLFWLRGATPARADPDTRYVATIGTDEGNDCKTAANPCTTIQRAIDVADPGDQIHVADGTYTSAIGTVAVITKELWIIGSYDPSFNTPDPEVYQTVLDAQWGGSVISITNAGDVLLMHLILTHGDGSGNCGSEGCGGGIYATGTSLHVGHCVITDNVGSSTGYCGRGGGIYVHNWFHPAPAEIWDSRLSAMQPSLPG
jgi:hypothetical protein